MKSVIKHVCATLLLAFVAVPAHPGDGVPCTQDGFYYAVCPIQPELSNKRVVDGSKFLPLPADEPNKGRPSYLPPSPALRHIASSASKPSLPGHGQPAASAQKNWRNYTVADWMSLASIFLLALIVGVVFYLVSRTIRNEARKTA